MRYRAYAPRAARPSVDLHADGVRFRVPALLERRDLATRLVAAACRMVGWGGTPSKVAPPEFEHDVVSAFGEAFNNIVEHAYAGRPGEIEIALEPRPDGLTIRLIDDGDTFDPSQVPMPDLSTLPERGLGLFILQSTMDDVSYYREGGKNVLAMTKRLRG